MEQLYLGKNYKLYYKSVALQYLNNQDLQVLNHYSPPPRWIIFKYQIKQPVHTWHNLITIRINAASQ